MPALVLTQQQPPIALCVTASTHATLLESTEVKVPVLKLRKHWVERPEIGHVAALGKRREH